MLQACSFCSSWYLCACVYVCMSHSWTGSRSRLPLVPCVIFSGLIHWRTLATRSPIKRTFVTTLSEDALTTTGKKFAQAEGRTHLTYAFLYFLIPYSATMQAVNSFKETIFCRSFELMKLKMQGMSGNINIVSSISQYRAQSWCFGCSIATEMSGLCSI